MPLNDRDFLRYSRQLLLEEFGLPGQEKLSQARVLIIGLGGLGSPAVLYLAAAGVGTLHLVDDDLLHVSNLQRQVLYRSEDTDQPKALLARQHLLALNPHIEVVAHQCRLDETEPQRNCRTAGVLGPVVGIMGTQQALEALKLLTGNRVESGKLRLFDGRQQQCHHLTLEASQRCPVCGGRDAHSGQ